VLAKGPAIVPVIGSRPAQLTESLGALEVSLTPPEVARLERRFQHPPLLEPVMTTIKCGCSTASVDPFSSVRSSVRR
jgi:hypothetical protein